MEEGLFIKSEDLGFILDGNFLNYYMVLDVVFFLIDK